MSTALVTGSAGFLGRHFVAALARDGWQVTGVDVVSPHPPPLDGVRARLYGGVDCRAVFGDRVALFGDARYDLIVHCAATVGGRAVIDGAPLEVATNLSLDVELFRYAARCQPASHVLYLSSSAVYPVGLQTEPGYRLAEDDVDWRHLGMPDAMYGWAKLTGELLARHAVERGVSVTVVRPFSGYGADQSADYPFPAFIARAVAGADPFPIWGPGTQVRDWVHVDDVVATALAAAEARHLGPVNIGTGTPTSMLDLASLVCMMAGYRPVLQPQPGAPSGVAYRVADPTRMLELRRPRVPLAEGIDQALAAAQWRARLAARASS